MQLLAVTAALLLGTSFAAPTPEEHDALLERDIQSIQECRANAKSDAEECACFPGCTITPAPESETVDAAEYTINMDTNATWIAALQKRQGCANPRAYLTPSGTIINMGTTPPDRLYTTIFEKCGQRGCDPNPTTMGTNVIEGSGRNVWGTTARVAAGGWYRDWPDRDAGCGLIREASRQDVRVDWRRPGFNCRPGMDCEQPNSVPQHYQRNFYQINHWNDCGHQAHVQALVSVDNVGTDSKNCGIAIDAINGSMGWMFGQWGWLFGMIRAVCN